MSAHIPLVDLQDWWEAICDNPVGSFRGSHNLVPVFEVVDVGSIIKTRALK